MIKRIKLEVNISDDPKEYERLDVEIDVLKSNYDK